MYIVWRGVTTIMMLCLDLDQLDFKSVMDDLEYKQTLCDTCSYIKIYGEQSHCPYGGDDYEYVEINSSFNRKMLLCNHWRNNYDFIS